MEASLTGFEPASIPCASAGTEQPVRLVLKVAPIRETTIVTATRTEAPTSQVGASATVFTAEDLERRQTPLVADLLMATPGAMLVRSGGPGALTSLFVRGGESDYNKVLLDGVPLNEPGGSFYLNNLTTENLERVEIVRGAYSSLFGSDAMASVIQLFTRRGDRAVRRPKLSAQIDGGTYHTFHANAGVSGATERLDYSLGAARFDSDNRVPNSGLGNTTLSANVGVPIGGTATLRFIGRGELERVGTPGTTAFGRPDLDAFFERHDGVGSVSFDQQVNRAFRQRASYSLATSNQRSTDLLADPPYTATFEGRVALFAIDRLSERQPDRSQAAPRQLSGRLAADHGRPTRRSPPDAPRGLGRRARHAGGPALRQSHGEFPQQLRRVGPAADALAAGVRHGRRAHRAQRQLRHRGRAARHGGLRRASDLGSFGETQIKASAGTGIKEPTMLESFSLSPFFSGNPDLKPERSRSVEVGVEQRVAHDRAKFELTYFHNRFSDIISLVTTNPSTFEGQFFNVGVTRARGSRRAWRWRPRPPSGRTAATRFSIRRSWKARSRLTRSSGWASRRSAGRGIQDSRASR